MKAARAPIGASILCMMIICCVQAVPPGGVPAVTPGPLTAAVHGARALPKNSGVVPDPLQAGLTPEQLQQEDQAVDFIRGVESLARASAKVLSGAVQMVCMRAGAACARHVPLTPHFPLHMPGHPRHPPPPP